MKTSANGRRLIEIWEEGGKAKLTPYDDGTGTLTIGFGHTSAAGPPKVVSGMHITPEQADEIFANDLAAVERDVNKLVKVPLNQSQFDVLVSFHFNTGALGRSGVLTVLNQGRYTAVPGQLIKWIRGGGRVMPGLISRRKAEIALWSKPIKENAMPAENPAVIPSGTPVVVETASIWGSKTLWTQLVGVVTSVVALASGYKINLSPETQASIILAIQGITSVLTLIWKNYYTTTITSASAATVINKGA